MKKLLSTMALAVALFMPVASQAQTPAPTRIFNRTLPNGGTVNGQGRGISGPRGAVGAGRVNAAGPRGSLNAKGGGVVVPGVGAAGAGRATVTGKNGGKATTTQAGAVLKGRGAAGAGTSTVTGRNGGTATTAHAGAAVKGQGAARASASKWNGKNSSGTASSAATLRKGTLHQQGAATVTNKKTGKTSNITDTATFNKGSGGTIDVTDNGKSVTKTIPPEK